MMRRVVTNSQIGTKIVATRAHTKQQRKGKRKLLITGYSASDGTDAPGKHDHCAEQLVFRLSKSAASIAVKNFIRNIVTSNGGQVMKKNSSGVFRHSLHQGRGDAERLKF